MTGVGGTGTQHAFKRPRSALDIAQMRADRTRKEHTVWRWLGRYHVREGREAPADDAELYRRVQPSPEEAA